MGLTQILIAEDELLVARDVEHLLTRAGYSIAGKVSTGMDALALCAAIHPDLVLMDILLQGSMSGLQAALQIHESLHIPVIFLTAHSDPDTIRQATASHPYGYVLKPIEFHGLQATIEMALNLHAAELKLAASEARYRAIMETALDGFCVIDQDGSFCDVNEALCQMLGYNRDELLKKNLSEIEVSATPTQVEERIRRVVNGGSERFESRKRRVDGLTIDAEVSMNYLPLQEQVFVTVRDITPRKGAEERILKLNKDLQRRALENLHLYQAEKDQRELAETLVEASETLVINLNVDVVLDRILEQISRIVKNDVCNIMLIEGDHTRVVRSRGYEAFDAGSFIETFVFPLSGLSIRRQIIETGESIVVPDVRSDPHWQRPAGAAWLRSYMAVPIHIQKKVIGFINVGISMPGFYGESHVQRLNAFAHHAAIAFQNARLFEETRDNAARLQQLSRRLLDVQEGERRYIARELHDEIGQSLTATKINLQAIQRSLTSVLTTSQEMTSLEMTSPEMHNQPPKGSIFTQLDTTMNIVEVVLQHVRNISLNLHPSLLDDLGLVPALRWLVDREIQWNDYTAQVIADDLDKRLPSEIELACFRVVQEALTNVARYSKASRVVVELWQRGADIHVVVRDNGIGFNVHAALEQANHGKSLGLMGMQERVMLLNGQIEISSSPGQGTEVHARLPAVQPEKESV